MKKLNALVGSLCLAFSLMMGNAWAMNAQDQAVVYESYTLEGVGKIGQAIAKMNDVLKKNPNTYTVHYRLGWLYYLDKKVKESVDNYKAASVLSPGSIEPWLAITLLYVNYADFMHLIPAALEVLKRDPNHYMANQRLILAYLRTKDHQKGLEQVERMLRLYPTDTVFLEQKAFMLKESGDLEQARVAASQLLLLSPKNLYAHTVLNGAK